MNLDDIYVGLVSTLIVIYIYVMYLAWVKDKQEIKNIYNKSHLSLKNDIKYSNVNYENYHNKIKNTMKKIIVENKKISIFNKMMNSSYTGLIRGGAVGFITGGTSNAAAAALVYGLVNPIVLFIQETYLYNELLPS